MAFSTRVSPEKTIGNVLATTEPGQKITKNHIKATSIKLFSFDVAQKLISSDIKNDIKPISNRYQRHHSVQRGDINQAPPRKGGNLMSSATRNFRPSVDLQKILSENSCKPRLKYFQKATPKALFNNYSKLPCKNFSKNYFKFVLTIHPELFPEIHSIKFQRFVSGILFPTIYSMFGMKSVQPFQPVHEDIGSFARTMSTPSTSSGKT